MDVRDNLFNELEKNKPDNSATQQIPVSPMPSPQMDMGNQQEQPVNQPQGNPNPQQYNQNSQQFNPNQQRVYGYNQYGYPMPAYNAPTPEQKMAMEIKESKQRIKNEKAIVVLFVILVIIAGALAVGGIVWDVVTSGKRLENFNKGESVIVYQNSKPENSAELTEKLDEYGRYTTEGVATAVRDSIVEIYTYADSFQNKLQGTGSGVVLNEDGYIVTNAHVLQADGYHDVHTSDGKVYSATIVGRDSKTDIAVLKINAPDLTPAILGNSDEVVVGEEVIAIGNPAGLTGTVTNGIVSAVNREIRSDSTGFEMNCIQTNAAISPGNSGGALVNMYGQVIGITSSKYISGLYEGLGFAITINEAKPIIEELIGNGFIGGRFRIGITLIDMSSEPNIATIEDELGFELPEGFKGVYINAISEDCDIANTALKAGDFITKIDGTPVETYDQLYDTISASYGAGDVVPATCAKVNKNGEIEKYEIEFMLMEDTSGDY